MPLGFQKAVHALVTRFANQRPIRTGSLIVTLFGDAILPRGGTVSLASLVKILQTFGLNERLIRTAAFRSAKNGWLTTTKLGRQSYYSLTETGRRQFEEATKRIYGNAVDEWDGSWLLVVLPSSLEARRDAIRKDLIWLGFGQITTGLLGHPTADAATMTQHLSDQGVLDQVIVMQAELDRVTSRQSVSELVRTSWPLDDIEQRYRDFLQTFRPVYKAARTAGVLDPHLCLLARTLLIHEYRKIILRDPLLPSELLPSGWLGTAAYQLCRNLYGLVCWPAETYLSEHLETAEGPLPKPSRQFEKRFGGLPKRPPVPERKKKSENSPNA